MKEKRIDALDHTLIHRFGDGGWTPSSRSTYNIDDPVVRSTVQVRLDSLFPIYNIYNHTLRCSIEKSHPCTIMVTCSISLKQGLSWEMDSSLRLPR